MQENNYFKTEKDTMKDLCIAQGYCPVKCKLNGMIIFGLTQKGEYPCDGCNIDRNECNGRPYKIKGN